MIDVANLLTPVLPEIFMAISGMVLLMAGVFKGNAHTKTILGGSIIVYALTILLLLQQDYAGPALFEALVIDEYATFLKFIILTGLIAVTAISRSYIAKEKIDCFEYPVLILFSGLGMMLMVSANSLLTLYIALELQSLALYILAAIKRDSARSSEAGLKYFVLGALSSGMLLFGISIIYGFTGSIHFDSVAGTLNAMDQAGIGVIVGLVFVLVGFAFKISAVPFHMWTPDVYEGVPASVTALFAVVPKIAAIGLLMRFLYELAGPIYVDWVQILMALSVLSMVWGAFAALTQNNIKRLIAYSSIGHMGYALLGIIAGTEAGASATLFYLAIYMVMTAGLFAALLCLRRNGVAIEDIPDMAGLIKTNPFIAYAITLFMFSMAGVPPFAGFLGKLSVFTAVVESQYYILAVIGVISSVVAAYYYLRVIKVVLFDASFDKIDGDDLFEKRIVMLVCGFFTAGLIFNPSFLSNAAAHAVSSLF